MNKIVIEFDKKKASDKNVMIEELMTKTDGIFERRNFTKEGTGIYIGKDDFDFMVVAGVLQQLEWFKEFVSKWLWYEYEDDADSIELDDDPVDLIKRYELSK